MLIEGIMTITAAIVLYPFMVNTPEDAHFLTEEERAYAIARIQSEFPGQRELVDRTRGNRAGRAFFYPTVRRTAPLTDVADFEQVWLLGTAFVFVNIAVQGLAVFTPSVVASIFTAESPINKQLLAVPPNLVGAFVKIAAAWYAERQRWRTPTLRACSARGCFCEAKALKRNRSGHGSSLADRLHHLPLHRHTQGTLCRHLLVRQRRSDLWRVLAR